MRFPEPSRASLLASCSLRVALCLLLSSAASAENPAPTQFACSGIVTFGDKTFHDQLILKVITKDDVTLGSPSGAPSAFDGSRPYRICINTGDKLTFEYTLGEVCGTTTSNRFGDLDKVAGTLKLTRIDKDAAFSGTYACHPDHR